MKQRDIAGPNAIKDARTTSNLKNAKPEMMKNISDCSVLVVDDAPDTAFILECILENTCRVHCISNGRRSGELHTRPLFDLKTEQGLKTIRLRSTQLESPL